MPTAPSPEAYIAALPPDRRDAIEAVRRVMRENLDPAFVEIMQYGMIGYAVPHSVYPSGYHCDPKQPLPFAGLASQKGHMSLYLMGVYANEPLREWFEGAWRATGKKLDMGKACVRFKKLEDVPLEVIAEVVRRMPAKAYIEHYEMSMKSPSSRARETAAKPATKKAVAKKSVSKKAVSKKSATKTAVTKKIGTKQAATTAARKKTTKAIANKPAARKATGARGRA